MSDDDLPTSLRAKGFREGGSINFKHAVTFTPSQYRWLQEQASERGWPITAMVRSCVVKAKAEQEKQ